jgi:hypothetical protein
MNTMVPLQLVWSLGLACVDIYAIRNRKDLHKRALVFFLVVGDGVSKSLIHKKYHSLVLKTFRQWDDEILLI